MDRPTMSFIQNQDRGRLIYTNQPPIPLSAPYSYQPPDLRQHPHAVNGLSQGNTASPVIRDDIIPPNVIPTDPFLLDLQSRDLLAPPQQRHPPPQQHPQPISQPIQNGSNGVPSQPPQLSASPSVQVPSLESANMTPPPEGTFATFEALLAAANQHAFAHGYAFVIGRSKKKNKLGLKKVLLSCDKGGTSHHKMLPLDSEMRKRKTTTRKTGCEFGVYAIESQQEWALKYRPDPACSIHNHPPSKSVTEHPAARKLNPTAIAAVKAMKDAGISAQETLKEIQREQPGTLLIARDVYNARAALRREPERVVDPAITPTNGPQIYRRATMTPDERLRDDLRVEVSKAREETERVREEMGKTIQELKNQLMQKDSQIKKFEMFIDICNERVMVRREELTDEAGGGVGST